MKLPASKLCNGLLLGATDSVVPGDSVFPGDSVELPIYKFTPTIRVCCFEFAPKAIIPSVLQVLLVTWVGKYCLIISAIFLL